MNVLGKAGPLVCYFLCGDGQEGKGEEGKGEKVRFKVEGGKEEVGGGVQEN